MTGREPLGDAYRVRSVEQALAILRVLEMRSGLTLPELAERVGMHAANAHKLVRNLEHEGLVELSPLTKRYRLGARRLNELAARALSNTDPWEPLRRSVPALAEATGMPGLIGVVAGGRVVYVEEFRGPTRALGRAFPAHATALGKALLAAVPEGRRESALDELTLDAWTTATITERARLADDLALTAERGYAIEDGELDLRRRSVGASVLDHTGRAVAAIGVGDSKRRLTTAKLDSVAEAVVEQAREASEKLGAAGPRRVSPRRFEVEVTGAVEPPIPSDAPAPQPSSRRAAEAHIEKRGGEA